MKRHRPGMIGFVVLLLAALFNLAALYTAERSFVELRDAAGSVRRTQLAQNLIERLYRLVVDAETGQRGYLLTGDQIYLVPYHDALQQNKQQLEDLRELVRDNPVQLAQLATVRSLLDARLAQIEESLALRRNGDNEGVQAFMASKKGAVTMDSLRLAINGMTAEEARLHERRLQSFTGSQDRVRQGFVVAVINLLLVTLGGIFEPDARRRNREATPRSGTHARQTVSESTAELTELSQKAKTRDS
jgi:CHASE3 domain sensor protein